MQVALVRRILASKPFDRVTLRRESAVNLTMEDASEGSKLWKGQDELENKFCDSYVVIFQAVLLCMMLYYVVYIVYLYTHTFHVI